VHPREVDVDVTATDSKGVAVQDLQKQDLTVTDDGQAARDCRRREYQSDTNGTEYMAGGNKESVHILIITTPGEFRAKADMGDVSTPGNGPMISSGVSQFEKAGVTG
jgi:hypothetical protein